jgi:two-component system response regulator FixJ
MTEATNKPHTPAYTVFVVDDDDGMRSALRRALMRAGFAVQPFASGQAFLDAYRPVHPAVLLLDVKMPEMSGLEVQAVLNERLIDLPVIFLTGAADVPVAVAAMKAGASDFIEKPFDNETLVARVRQCLTADSQWHGDNRYARGLALLTSREAEIMRLMVTGKTSKEIARDLDISHRTVEIHRARVMEKMQAETLAELVRMELAGRPDTRRV